MHVLIIPSEAYIPPECPTSGIFQRDQAVILKDAGYRVGVLSPNLKSVRFVFNKDAWRRFEYHEAAPDGIPVYAYDGWNWSVKRHRLIGWRWARSGMQLFKKYLSAEGRPDLIHCHNALYAGVLARRIESEFHIPYVITEHSSAFAQGYYPVSWHHDISAVYHDSHRLMVVSPTLGKILESIFGDAARRWEWMPNVVDPLFEDRPIPTSVDAPYKRSFTILSIGNLDDNKNHTALVEVFAKQFRGSENVFMRIGGEGPRLNALMGLTKALNVDKQVVFLGYRCRSEVLKEMDRCDVLVLPSHSETFGVVLIEALSRGKPVIATACGGPECIVNTRNGILIPTNDTDALAFALTDMYRHIDRYDAASIRKESLSNFGREALLTRLSHVYRSVLEAPNAEMIH